MGTGDRLVRGLGFAVWVGFCIGFVLVEMGSVLRHLGAGQLYRLHDVLGEPSPAACAAGARGLIV